MVQAVIIFYGDNCFQVQGGLDRVPINKSES